MKKRVYTKIAILLYATIVSQTLLAYETRKVSYAIYSEYMQKIPYTITCSTCPRRFVSQTATARNTNIAPTDRNKGHITAR